MIDFLMDYLDGILSEPQRARFEEHLAECSDCVAYVATYLEAVHIGKAVCSEEHEAAPPHVPEELVQAILSARSGKAR
jgi:anti-sigma factor RsiW